MKKTVKLVLVALIVVAAIIFVFRLYGYLAERAARRAYPIKYESLVKSYSAEFDVPESIIYAVIRTESAFDPNALSRAGAAGLMQITPDTYDWLLFLRREKADRSLYDPETNIKYGVYFLSYLKSHFGEWETAFAAYNAGFSRVNGWLDDPRYSENGRLVDIPYPETDDYVKKVVSAAEKYKNIYDID